MSKTYECTCGRRYTTPIPLVENPTCTNGGKHSTRTMKEKK